jgi:hypothetical protein
VNEASPLIFEGSLNQLDRIVGGTCDSSLLLFFFFLAGDSPSILYWAGCPARKLTQNPAVPLDLSIVGKLTKTVFPGGAIIGFARQYRNDVSLARRIRTAVTL